MFELCPHKIHALKLTTNNAVRSIHSNLEGISMNELPHEVKLFVRLYDTRFHQYKHYTLINSSFLLTYATRDKLVELSALTLFDLLYTRKEYPEEYSLHICIEMNISVINYSFHIFTDWNAENPCWVVPPNTFFADGNHPEFELTCHFLNNYATLVERDSYHFNQYIFQLLKLKIQASCYSKTPMKIFAIDENL